MKKLIPLFSAAALLTALPSQAAEDIESNPGYLDFKTYVGVYAQDSTVEVQLRRPLLRLAASIVEEKNPDVAQLINGVELVRVQVFEVNEENREQFAESVQAIARHLTERNWEQLVTVRDDGENVAIFANMPSDKAIAGIVISVSSGKEAVFVNVVGNVALEALAELGKHLNIPHLEKISGKIEDS